MQNNLNVTQKSRSAAQNNNYLMRLVHICDMKPLRQKRMFDCERHIEKADFIAMICIDEFALTNTYTTIHTQTNKLEKQHVASTVRQKLNVRSHTYDSSNHISPTYYLCNDKTDQQISIEHTITFGNIFLTYLRCNNHFGTYP